MNLAYLYHTMFHQKLIQGTAKDVIWETVLNNTPYDLEFSSNGMHFFVVTRNAGLNIADGDKLLDLI